MGKCYTLTGVLRREDEPDDGTMVTYLVRADGSERWLLTEGQNSKLVGQDTIEIEYRDFEPTEISLLRDDKVIRMDYLSLCDVVNLMNGIDIMKATRRSPKLTAGITVSNIKYIDQEISDLKIKLDTLSEAKLKKILEIANSTEK